MKKDKLNNLLCFKEYDKLSDNKKSTKRTDIGGDVINENIDLIAAMVNDAGFMNNIKDFVNALKPNVKELLRTILISDKYKEDLN